MEDDIKNRLKIEIDKAYYVSKRYEVPSTFAILYYEGELPVSKLSEFVRVSDLLLKIDDNRYFISFSFTVEGASKASQNLILDLDKYFNNIKSCIALDTFNESKSPTIVLNRLTQILREIHKKPHTRIEDESILNDMF